MQLFHSLWIAGLPVWILSFGALVCMVLDAILPKDKIRFIHGASWASLLLAIYFAFKQWGMPVPNGTDLFLADLLTQFFVILLLFIGLFSLFNLSGYLKLMNHSQGAMFSGSIVALVLFALVGMIFMFASDHLMVNFIGLETMSLAIYILVGSNRGDVRSNEAAIKYFVLGSVASAFLLYGIALFYGAFGTMQLSEAMNVSNPISQVWLTRASFVLILVGFVFKLGLFPFHFWVPDVYEGSPTPITGFMATGVKISVFALFLRLLATLHFFP